MSVDHGGLKIFTFAGISTLSAMGQEVKVMPKNKAIQ